MNGRNKASRGPKRLEVVLALVGLRYRLLWAQVRTANGKIALLILGCLALTLVVLLLLGGGFGAAIAAVRSGNLEPVTQSLLGGLFVTATSVSVMSGIGLREAFSDAALRVYPVNSTGRLVVRHVTAILEPVWILMVALEAGLATGLYVFAGGSYWLGWLAVLMLVGTNYLLARDLVCIAAGLMRFRGGTIILLTVVIGGALPALLLGPSISGNRVLSAMFLKALRLSPPFAAAKLLLPVRTADAAVNLGLLILWGVGLLGLLPHLERWSNAPRTVPAGGVTWGVGYDRIGRLFGSRMAPLIAKSLRYYLRCSKVKYMFLVAPVLIAGQAVACPISRDPRERFVLTLCLSALAGICGPLPVSANQFGYEAQAFRRYLLAPVSPELIMRANSYVSLFLGGAETLVLLLLWVLFAPLAFDARMPLMLLAVALTVMCLFNAIAVWTSTMAPRAVDYETLVGFNVSVAAAVAFQAILWPAAITGHILRAKIDPDVILRFWWTALSAVPLGVAVYGASLRIAGATLRRTGERLMNRLEGRS